MISQFRVRGARKNDILSLWVVKRCPFMSGQDVENFGFPGEKFGAIFTGKSRESSVCWSFVQFILLVRKKLLGLERLGVLHSLHKGLEKLFLCFHTL